MSQSHAKRRMLWRHVCFKGAIPLLFVIGALLGITQAIPLLAVYLLIIVPM